MKTDFELSAAAKEALQADILLRHSRLLEKNLSTMTNLLERIEELEERITGIESLQFLYSTQGE